MAEASDGTDLGAEFSPIAGPDNVGIHSFCVQVVSMESIVDLFQSLTGRRSSAADIRPCQIQRHQWPDRNSLYYSRTLAGWPLYIEDWREQVATVTASIASLALGTMMIRKARRLGYVAARGIDANKLSTQTVLARDTDLPSTQVQDLMTRGVVLVSAPALYFTFRIGLIHYSSITPTKQPGPQ